MPLSNTERKYLKSQLPDSSIDCFTKYELKYEIPEIEPGENDLVISENYERVLKHRIKEKIKLMNNDLELAKNVLMNGTGWSNWLRDVLYSD